MLTFFLLAAFGAGCTGYALASLRHATLRAQCDQLRAHCDRLHDLIEEHVMRLEADAVPPPGPVALRVLPGGRGR